MILSDDETKIDLLNNEAIATTIVRLLRDHPDRRRRSGGLAFTAIPGSHCLARSMA